jgi:hypothetical protein
MRLSSWDTAAPKEHVRHTRYKTWPYLLCCLLCLLRAMLQPCASARLPAQNLKDIGVVVGPQFAFAFAVQWLPAGIVAERRQEARLPSQDRPR